MTNPTPNLTPSTANTVASHRGSGATPPESLFPGGSGMGMGQDGNRGNEVPDDVTVSHCSTQDATDRGSGAAPPGSRTTGGWGKGLDGNEGAREVRHVECQTTELFLSHLTTVEVIPTLTHLQATRELKYFKSLQPGLKPRGGKKTPTRAAINECLISATTPSLLSDFDNISENMSVCHKLIKSFAYTADKLEQRSDEIERNMGALSEAVSEYRQRRQVEPSTTGTDFNSSINSFHSLPRSPLAESRDPPTLEFVF